MIFGYKDKDIKKIYCQKCNKKTNFRRYYNGIWHCTNCNLTIDDNGDIVHLPTYKDKRYVICPRCGYLDYTDGKTDPWKCKACEYPQTIDTGYSAPEIDAFKNKYPPSTIKQFKSELRMKYTKNSEVFHSKAYDLVLKLDKKHEQEYNKEHNIIPGYEDEHWYNEHNNSKNNSSNSYIPTTICCPKCGSNNISIGQRGYTFITGFVGSNKTMNRCGNCGYKWEP